MTRTSRSTACGGNIWTFLEFLRLITTVYHAPSGTASAASENRHSKQLPPSTAPAGRHGLTAVNTATGGGVSGLLSATCVSADVGNFNLVLDMSLSDSENNSGSNANESTQDMFL